ncbi:MAG: formylglycine-generating enzyme family protein [Planctomycetota bacterium]|jgi:formylglycine-generating enzyme required for sulfatase activity
MEVHYCEGCGARIEEAEAKTGVAMPTAQGGFFCPKCSESVRRDLTQVEGAAAGPAGAAGGDDFEIVDAVEEGGEPAGESRAGVSRAASRRRTTARSGGRAGEWSRRRVLVTAAVGGVASCAAAFALILLVMRPKDVPRPSGKDAKAPAEKEAPKEGESAEGGEETPPTPGEKGGEKGGEAAAKEEPKQLSEEELKAKAAREAFETLEGLVEKGEFDEAGKALTRSASLFAGTDYALRARQLVAKAKAEHAIAEIAKLWRTKEYVEALWIAERALVEAVGTEQAERLKDLSVDLRKKVKAIEEAERRRLAEEEADRRRREKERVEAEKRQVAARKRALYDDIRRQGKEAFSRGDHDRAISFFERARGHLDIEEIAEDILQVKQAVRAGEARRLVESGDIDAGIAAYRKAAAIKPGGKVAEELARLEARRQFLLLASRADGLARRGKWKDASSAYREARAAASEPADRERISKALKELAFGETCARAEELARSRRWREAVMSARKALAMKPRAPRARRVLARAKEALRPRDGLTNSIGMRFVLVHHGTFIMGSEDGRANEEPLHRVRLSAYYIGVTEVTNAQYESYDPKHSSKRSRESPGDDHPVVEVSYADATAFCEWLTGKEGHKYRLPTEAEWERAARGAGGIDYPWGDEPPGELGTCRCNFAMRARKGPGRDGFVHAAPVGTYREWGSPVGCLDMAGNVAEWCADWYEPEYYDKSPKADPTGPEAKTSGRVVRGGSWRSDAGDVRSAARSHRRPKAHGPALGFRVLREVVRFLDE